MFAAGRDKLEGRPSADPSEAASSATGPSSLGFFGIGLPGTASGLRERGPRRPPPSAPEWLVCDSLAAQRERPLSPSDPPPQVLHHCCASPRTIEALVNSYEHVRVTEEWAEAVPAELVQVSRGLGLRRLRGRQREPASGLSASLPLPLSRSIPALAASWRWLSGLSLNAAGEGLSRTSSRMWDTL